MKVIEFLKSFLSAIGSISDSHSASCPVCGCVDASSREPHMDMERVRWQCGCKVDYSSNFPGVTKILITESCKPKGQ